MTKIISPIFFLLALLAPCDKGSQHALAASPPTILLDKGTSGGSRIVVLRTEASPISKDEEEERHGQMKQLPAGGRNSFLPAIGTTFHFFAVPPEKAAESTEIWSVTEQFPAVDNRDLQFELVATEIVQGKFFVLFRRYGALWVYAVDFQDRRTDSPATMPAAIPSPPTKLLEPVELEHSGFTGATIGAAGGGYVLIDLTSGNSTVAEFQSQRATPEGAVGWKVNFLPPQVAEDREAAKTEREIQEELKAPPLSLNPQSK